MMTVDVGSLSAAEFLMMLYYEGDPPSDPEFDKIRMSPADWRVMFPSAAATAGEEVPDDRAAPTGEGAPPDPAAAEAPH